MPLNIPIPKSITEILQDPSQSLKKWLGISPSKRSISSVTTITGEQTIPTGTIQKIGRYNTKLRREIKRARDIGI